MEPSPSSETVQALRDITKAWDVDECKALADAAIKVQEEK
jgi:hypothetical protein